MPLSMPWFKKKSPASDSAPPLNGSGDEGSVAPAPAENDGAAVAAADEAAADLLWKVMDTLAAVAREYGKGAFDIESLRADALRRECDQWAEHLLVGAAKPGQEGPQGATPIGRRDYLSFRRYFAERRSEESGAVTRTVGALQQSLWATLKALDGVVLGSGNADGQIGTQVARLQAIAQGGSAEMMRREVLSVVSQMEQIGKEKLRRQEQAVTELKSKVAALGQELEVAWQESSIDPLTRLYNRRAFDERCGQVMAMRRLFGERSSLLMIDIDHFKAINDHHGHPGGDAVLREVADVVARSFLSRRDFVARYGGEEFVVLLWGVGLDRAKVSAERLREAIRRRPFQLDKRKITVTVSIGVAELSADEDLEAWIKRSDMALYTAKRRGRDRVVLAAE
jgi:diguanylate cyclase (GGDEF)-like protein